MKPSSRVVAIGPLLAFFICSNAFAGASELAGSTFKWVGQQSHLAAGMPASSFCRDEATQTVELTFVTEDEIEIVLKLISRHRYMDMDRAGQRYRNASRSRLPTRNEEYKKHRKNIDDCFANVPYKPGLFQTREQQSINYHPPLVHNRVGHRVGNSSIFVTTLVGQQDEGRFVYKIKVADDGQSITMDPIHEMRDQAPNRVLKRVPSS